MQRDQGPDPQRPIASAAFQPTSSGTGNMGGSSDTVCPPFHIHARGQTSLQSQRLARARSSSTQSLPNRPLHGQQSLTKHFVRQTPGLNVVQTAPDNLRHMMLCSASWSTDEQMVETYFISRAPIVLMFTCVRAFLLLM